MVNDYLLKQGPLTGLQRELTHEYIAPEYIREKCRYIRQTMDGLEHDLDICVAIEKNEFPFMESPQNEPDDPPAVGDPTNGEYVNKVGWSE